MQIVMELALRAENCATAALAAFDTDERLEFIRQSAVWRNEELRQRLGPWAECLNSCPFTEDQLSAGRARAS